MSAEGGRAAEARLAMAPPLAFDAYEAPRRTQIMQGLASAHRLPRLSSSVQP